MGTRYIIDCNILHYKQKHHPVHKKILYNICHFHNLPLIPRCYYTLCVTFFHLLETRGDNITP